jgi:hypothetical protein
MCTVCAHIYNLAESKVYASVIHREFLIPKMGKKDCTKAFFFNRCQITTMALIIPFNQISFYLFTPYFDIMLSVFER